MNYLLFYVEDDTLVHNQRVLIDSWCAMAGIKHLMVDKTGLLRRTNGNVFTTIEDAIAAFPDFTFVFFDQAAPNNLKTYVHPIDSVIYCLGSDTDGFQGLNLSPYTSLSITQYDGSQQSWYATLLVPMIIGHRMYG